MSSSDTAACLLPLKGTSSSQTLDCPRLDLSTVSHACQMSSLHDVWIDAVSLVIVCTLHTHLTCFVFSAPPPYTYMHTHTHTHTHTLTLTHTHTHMHTQRTRICTHTHTLTHTQMLLTWSRTHGLMIIGSTMWKSTEPQTTLLQRWSWVRGMGSPSTGGPWVWSSMRCSLGPHPFGAPLCKSCSMRSLMVCGGGGVC